MSLWRRIAIERFPQLHRAVADAESAAWAWFAIRHALLDAYRQRPLDEAFVADVYDYAHWCLTHPSVHVRNAVLFWFYEELATDDPLRLDMGRWMTQEDFDRVKHLWQGILTDENWNALRKEFAARKAEQEGVASRNHRNALRKARKAERANF